MEAARLLGNLRGPVHAIILLSDSIISEQFGSVNEGYKTHASHIQDSASQILEIINDALGASCSNVSEIGFGSASIIIDRLNEIIGSAKIIRFQLMGPVQVPFTENAKRIHGNADALLDDLNSIQDLTGADAKILGPNSEELTEIEQVIRANLVWIEPYSLRKGIHIDFTPGLGASHLFCDRIRLRLVLSYLMRNLVKHGQPGAKVVIRTELSAEGVGVVLADTGHGILVDGLALALAKKFIEQQGGEFKITWIQDQGNVLHLLFPLDRLRSKQA